MVDWATWRAKVRFLDGLGQFFPGGFHQRTVEGSSDRQHQCTTRSSVAQGATGSFHGRNLTGNHQLARTVVIGCNHNAFRVFANAFHHVVVKPEDGSHGGWLKFTGFLHGIGPGADKAKALFKGQGIRSYKGAEFAEAVACHHVGLKHIFQTLGQDDRMQKDRGLGNGSLLQFVVCP